jgi:hypothetical protein
MEWLIILLWLITAPLWVPVVLIGAVLTFMAVYAAVAIPVALVHEFGRNNGWWR